MNTTFFSELLAAIAERGRAVLDSGRGRRSTGDSLGDLCDSLLSGGGEASGTALARQILDAYGDLDSAAKTGFFRMLSERYGPDPERLAHAISVFEQDPSEANASALHEAAEPRRQELIRRLNLAPGGTAALVAMRRDLLERLPAHADFRFVDRDFGHLFSAWFNRGFLVLRQIGWNTPASILEKIIRYEAVHEIRDWDDLRRRIDPPDRRCFAFFHPALIDEPLIFVEVALTRDMPEAIAPILADDRKILPAREAMTACFYSISNCQRGLAGISFGNFLIKQVVEELVREFTNLETFVTLSPVPDFTAWLEEIRAGAEPGLISAEEAETLALLDMPGWAATEAAKVLEPLLLSLAARYFLKAKNRQQRPRDAVARFHLGNGARLERINFLADRSPKAIARSAGLMVNYLYALDAIEENHEAYANQGTVIAAKAVRALASRRVPERKGATA